MVQLSFLLYHNCILILIHILGSSSDTETSSCPVLTSLIRQREEAMFQELISLDTGTMSLSPSLSPHPENVGPVVRYVMEFQLILGTKYHEIIMFQIS